MTSKKALSLLLSLVMILSILPVSAFAADTDYGTQIGTTTDGAFTDTTTASDTAYTYTVVGSDGSIQTFDVASVPENTGNSVLPDTLSGYQYTKVDSVTSGETYLLVYNGNAMNGSFGSTAVTVEDSTITGDYLAAEWTIEHYFNDYYYNVINSSNEYLSITSSSAGKQKSFAYVRIQDNGATFTLIRPYSARYLVWSGTAVSVSSDSSDGTPFTLYQKGAEVEGGEVFKVSTAGLDKLIAKNFTEADYPADLWAAYKTAHTAAQNAKNALQNPYATAEEANAALATIDTAHANLQTAIDALEKIAKHLDIEWQRTLEPANKSKTDYGELVVGIPFLGAAGDDGVYPTIEWKFADDDASTKDIADLTTDPSMEVWDYNTDSQYASVTKTAGVQAATWNEHEQGTTAGWMDASIRKFAGTFKWPEGFDFDDSAIIQSVNDANYQPIYDYINADETLKARFGSSKVIPVNDDMYIFIYKHGDNLTADNYLNHLVFWSGTSGKGVWSQYSSAGRDDWDRRTPATYNNVPATPAYRDKYPNNLDTTNQAVTDTNADLQNSFVDLPSSVLSTIRHTDGWYTLSDTNALMTTLNNLGYSAEELNGATSAEDDNTLMHIDIYCFDNDGSGGMDMLDFKFIKAPETTATVTVNYYLDMVDASSLLGTTQMTAVDIGTEITLTDGATVNELNYYKVAAMNVAKGEVKNGVQQAPVPYTVVAGENVINVVYTKVGSNTERYTYDFAVENIYADVLTSNEKVYLSSVALGENGETSLTLENGSKVEYDNSTYSISYTPGADAIASGSADYVDLKLTYSSGASATITKRIYFVPASNVLYEENFMVPETGNDKKADWVKVDENSVAQVTDNKTTVYGTTAAYGSSSGENGVYTVTVNKNAKTSENLKFSFYGNGFDLIGTCAADSGTAIVQVKNENNKVEKVYVINTAYGDKYGTLSQVPLLHCTGLAEGKHTVSVYGAYIQYAKPQTVGLLSYFGTSFSYGVSSEAICEVLYELGFSDAEIAMTELIGFDESGAISSCALEDADELELFSVPTATEVKVRLDSFRVYRSSSRAAYSNDQGEYGASYMNVLDAATSSETEPFVAYLEFESETTSYTLKDYERNGGPQNEVYLEGGNDPADTVALNVGANAVVQISVRNVDEDYTAKLKTMGANTAEIPITHATEMYYRVQANSSGLITIQNSGTGLLAICNVKIEYSASGSGEFGEDELAELNNMLLGEMDLSFEPEMFEAKLTSMVLRRKNLITLTVNTSDDVAYLLVNGEYVWPSNEELVEEGLMDEFIFTISETFDINETYEYEIIACDFNGNESDVYFVD